MYRQQYGFSLIEISLVIIVIGLLAAAVSAGQSLVHQAKLRSIVTEYYQHLAAVNSFKVSYNGLPGDLSNASEYGFGDSGNGNGNLNDTSTWCGLYNEHEGEFTEFWRHLSNAGLIDGNYTGGSVLNTNVHQILPKSKLGYYWGAYYFKWSTYDKLWGSEARANYFLLGVRAEDGNSQYDSTYVISPKDMYVLDSKIDDGMPNLGIMQAKSNDIHAQQNGQNCGRVFHASIYTANATADDNYCITGTTGNGTADSVYHVANEEKICVIGLLMD